jgi:hypothetical protein
MAGIVHPSVTYCIACVDAKLKFLQNTQEHRSQASDRDTAVTHQCENWSFTPAIDGQGGLVFPITPNEENVIQQSIAGG